MNIDEVLRETDPARGHPDRVPPGLLNRVLDTGPASTGTRSAVLAGALTAVVTLSVVAGLDLARQDTSAPAGAPTAEPFNCLDLVRGWRPAYLPPGFAVDGGEENVSYDNVIHRGQNYSKRTAEQPRSEVTVALDRSCTDPALPTPVPQPPVTTSPNSPKVTTWPAEWTTIRGHRASLFDHEQLLWLSWEEQPGLRLSLRASNSDPTLPNLPLPELVRIAEGLTHGNVTADPTPEPPPCPGLASYRARTLPPGYREAEVRPDGDWLTLTYVKGTGSGAAEITAVLTCHTVVEHYPPRNTDPVTVHGKQAWISRPGEGTVQLMWNEGEDDLWAMVSGSDRDDVLAIAEGLRAG